MNAEAKSPASTPVVSRLPERVAVVLPVFNQLDFTRGCLQSLAPDLAAGAQLIVINNGSTDGTAAYLSSRQWTVIMNNDVLVAPGWLEALLDFAARTGAEIVAPALREGPLNYPFQEYAADFTRRMRLVRRWGQAHGICFMVRTSVFETVGAFDENFRVGQFEDADFFLRAKLAGVQMAVTGAAFLHHFGSVTQNAIRAAPRPPGGPSYYAENRAYYLRKWRLGRLQRLAQRWRRISTNWRQRTAERLRHGHSLHEKWLDGRLRYF
ncbi:MAG: glycosyltransferase [Verrucomicrobiota bacterium]